MIIVMLWRPRGKGHGHASLAVTQPRTDGKGSESFCVCTWFPGGEGTSGSGKSGGNNSGSGKSSRSSALCFKSSDRSIPTDVWEEMSDYMAGGQRRVFKRAGSRKSARAASVLRLGAQVLGRLQVIYDEIKVERQEEAGFSSLLRLGGRGPEPSSWN